MSRYHFLFWDSPAEAKRAFLFMSVCGLLVALESCSSIPPGAPKAVCAVIDIACGLVTVKYVEDGVQKEATVPASVLLDSAKSYQAKKEKSK